MTHEQTMRWKTTPLPTAVQFLDFLKLDGCRDEKKKFQQWTSHHTLSDLKHESRGSVRTHPPDLQSERPRVRRDAVKAEKN